jgi:hypothetical protein
VQAGSAQWVQAGSAQWVQAGSAQWVQAGSAQGGASCGAEGCRQRCMCLPGSRPFAQASTMASCCSAPLQQPPPRQQQASLTCSGCSSCCACLSDTRSQREGCASPVSLSLMPDTSLTFLAISLMSTSSFLILLE